VSNSAFNVN